MEINKPKRKSLRWEATEQASQLLLLPDELLADIFKSYAFFDFIIVRSTCKQLYNWISDRHPFPKDFILNQDECAKHFVALGSTSCLEYLKNSLHFFFASDLPTIAAQNNNFEMLKFLHENDCLFTPNAPLAAARVGNIDMLQYCLDHGVKRTGYFKKFEYLLCTEAAGSGHLQMLQYLHEHGFQMTDSVTQTAALQNQVETLKYALDHGCTFSTGLSSCDLGVLQVLQRRGLDWKPYACSFAAQKGNLQALKWAHENGAPWDMAVMHAIWNGHVDCLRYIVAEGQRPIEYVKHVGSVGVLKFLWEENIERQLLSDQIYSFAVENLDRETVEYLYNYTKINKPDSLGTLAAYAGDLEFFKWCIEDLKFGTMNHTYEDDYETMDVLEAAFNSDNYDIIHYVITHNLAPRLRSTTEYVENNLAYSSGAAALKLMYEVERFEFTTMMQSVVRQSNIEAIDWMIDKGANFTSQHLTHAAQFCQLTAISRLIKLGCEFTTGCSFGNLLCYKYAHEHGYNQSPDTLEFALRGDRVDLLHYMVLCGHVTLDGELYKKAKKFGTGTHTLCIEYLEKQGVQPNSAAKLLAKAKNVISSLFK